MPGFDNNTMYADNVDFRGVQPVVGQITTNGQLSIGSTATPNIRTGALTSPLGTITIGYSSPNITLDLAGSGEAIDSIAVQTGTSPIVPTAAGLVTINGAVVAAGTNPIRSDGTGANTMALEVQISQALAATDATKIGLSNFDSAAFDVDANGFVQLNGGGIAATAFDVQANTAPGTDPVVPTAAGVVIVNGAAVANHSVVLETRSRAANAYNLEVQYSAAVAATDATKSGVAHFDSANFTVDANGFVSATTTGFIKTLTGNSGGPRSPTANNINIVGGTSAAGTTPIAVAGAASTLTVNAQTSQALAAADATKIGLSNFDSSSFAVAATGFVTLSPTGAGKTITGDTGGALSPTAGNWNILGQQASTIAVMDTIGSGSTLSVENRTWPTQFVVDPSSTVGLRGTFTTIQAAINAASTGTNIFIRPGTYTENLTLVAGVNLSGMSGGDEPGQVVIVGSNTFTGTGTVTISNVRIQTNSGFIAVVSGSAASSLIFESCNFQITNNTGFSLTSSNASSGITLMNCEGNITTTGITLFVSTGAGTFQTVSTQINNSGGATTTSSASSGTVSLLSTIILCPITTTSTALFTSRYCDIDTSAINTTALTCGGSVSSHVEFCSFISGTASAVSIGSTLTMTLCEINSTNTNTITGAGTLVYTGLSFPNTSNGINTTTLTRRVIDGGSYKGQNTNTTVPAGMIGEQIRSFIAVGGRVILTNNVSANITSISLTAGVWDVSLLSSIHAEGGVVTLTAWQSSISTTSATLGTPGDNSTFTPTAPNAVADVTMAIPSYRISLAATTTVYFVMQATFSAGDARGYGRISATRVA